jgi:fimbrial isopeptide formation D2 family protein/LPXTG-motif cell wall-anchored protein
MKNMVISKQSGLKKVLAACLVAATIVGAIATTGLGTINASAATFDVTGNNVVNVHKLQGAAYPTEVQNNGVGKPTELNGLTYLDGAHFTAYDVSGRYYKLRETLSAEDAYAQILTEYKTPHTSVETTGLTQNAVAEAAGQYSWKSAQSAKSGSTEVTPAVLTLPRAAHATNYTDQPAVYAIFETQSPVGTTVAKAVPTVIAFPVFELPSGTTELRTIEVYPKNETSTPVPNLQKELRTDVTTGVNIGEVLTYTLTYTFPTDFAEHAGTNGIDDAASGKYKYESFNIQDLPQTGLTFKKWVSYKIGTGLDVNGDLTGAGAATQIAETDANIGSGSTSFGTGLTASIITGTELVKNKSSKLNIAIDQTVDDQQTARMAQLAGHTIAITVEVRVNGDAQADVNLNNNAQLEFRNDTENKILTSVDNDVDDNDNPNDPGTNDKIEPRVAGYRFAKNDRDSSAYLTGAGFNVIYPTTAEDANGKGTMYDNKGLTAGNGGNMSFVLVTAGSSSTPNVYRLATAEDTTGVTDEVQVSDAGTFVIYGMQANVKYHLKEVTIPTGYLLLYTEDTLFNVVSKVTDAQEGTLAVGSYTDSDNATDAKNALFNKDDLVNDSYHNIPNIHKGFLPKTGGTGVAIFFGAALIFAVAAGTIFSRRKKDEVQVIAE